MESNPKQLSLKVMSVLKEPMKFTQVYASLRKFTQVYATYLKVSDECFERTNELASFENLGNFEILQMYNR